jgi:glycerol-3-phosphate dehydrogenase (NAD(P)+)
MKISILGAGSWGLTIAKLLSEKQHEIYCWTNSQKEVELLQAENRYEAKLPGVELPASFIYSTDLHSVLNNAEIVVMAVPSQFVESVARQCSAATPAANCLMVSLTKGITQGSHRRMSQILIEDISWLKADRTAVLSGPSHAEEVAAGIPTSVVMACSDLSVAARLQKVFSNEYFRVYTSDDVIGVELCGSLKNVVAIATGILDGLGLGDNTKGALMTRGLAEISRLGENMGAQMRTFAGLAGMGDLITTCISRHSRNRHVGEQIGKGRSLKDILNEMVMVAEGVPTCRSGWEMAQKSGVDMPITEAVYKVLFEGKDPGEAAAELMTRELKLETI